MLERALVIQGKYYEPDHFEVAKLLTNLGAACRTLGNPHKAKELLEQALPTFEKHYGLEHFEVAGALINLGNTYGDLGDPQKAKELFEQTKAHLSNSFRLLGLPKSEYPSSILTNIQDSPFLLFAFLDDFLLANHLYVMRTLLNVVIIVVS